MDPEQKDILLIDEAHSPIIEENFVELNEMINDFVDCYQQNQDRPIAQWLPEKIISVLPEKSIEEATAMVQEISDYVRTMEEQKESLAQATANGRSAESWFAERVQQVTSKMTGEETVQYLQTLDNAVTTANESLLRTIKTKAGEFSKSHNLDGFIAEQEHVTSFNLNAEARGSQYRAEALHSTKKNSVDIVIRDAEGKIVRRYQSKYCKNASATQKAFEHGDYRGQQSLVPEEQAGQIKRKSTTCIEAPDGTQSNPLSKDRAKELQKEAQSGKWNPENWNAYKTKDIALGIGKQAMKAGFIGAAFSVGADVAMKLFNGEKIRPKEVAQKALLSGADMALKTVVTAAVKVGAEKGIIPIIARGTPVGRIANVVFIGIENAKILYKCAKGEVTPQQAFAQMEETTAAAAGGLMAMGIGAAKGAAIGTVLGGPFGAAIGGFIGGTVGYMAGSAIGTAIVKARRAITEKVSGWISSAAKKVWDWIRSPECREEGPVLIPKWL